MNTHKHAHTHIQHKKLIKAKQNHLYPSLLWLTSPSLIMNLFCMTTVLGLYQNQMSLGKISKGCPGLLFLLHRFLFKSISQKKRRWGNIFVPLRTLELLFFPLYKRVSCNEIWPGCYLCVVICWTLVILSSMESMKLVFFSHNQRDPSWCNTGSCNPIGLC